MRCDWSAGCGPLGAFSAEVDGRSCQGRLAVVGFDQVVFATGKCAVGLFRDICGGLGVPGSWTTAAGKRQQEGRQEEGAVEEFHDELVN